MPRRSWCSGRDAALPRPFESRESRCVAMLRASRRHFRNAFNCYAETFLGCADVHTQAKLLVLFYAIECGLKTIIMHSIRAEDTTEVGDDYSIGHDIRLGLKLLRAPPELVLANVSTAENDRRQPVTPDLLHQVFRYHIPLATSDVQLLEGQLRAVLEWLDNYFLMGL